MKTKVIQSAPDEPDTATDGVDATTRTPLAEPAAVPASTAARVRMRVAAFGRSESGVVALGAAVVAVHIADDNLLQPNPGTSAADHLVSGLVPIALVAGARRSSAGCARARAA